MSQKNSSPGPGDRRSGSRREELAAQTARAERDRRIRRRASFGLLGAALAVILFAGVWLGVSASRSRSADPAAAGGDRTIGVGQTTAPVRVDVYQDFMCPYCGQFEQVNGPVLAGLVEEGVVRLEIHPIAFLDQLSQGTKFSTRAANAFVTAAQASPEDALDFNAALYANQPAENTPGLTDEQIGQIALTVGIDQAVVDTFPDMQYERWVKEGTQQAFDDDITSTPTILIDGEQFTGDILSQGPLEQQIRTAAAGE